MSKRIVPGGRTKEGASVAVRGGVQLGVVPSSPVLIEARSPRGGAGRGSPRRRCVCGRYPSPSSPLLQVKSRQTRFFETSGPFRAGGGLRIAACDVRLPLYCTRTTTCTTQYYVSDGTSRSSTSRSSTSRSSTSRSLHGGGRVAALSHSNTFFRTRGPCQGEARSAGG